MPANQISLVPTDEIQMLEFPLGSDAKAAVFVEAASQIVNHGRQTL
jgi:hypothetical protein